MSGGNKQPIRPASTQPARRVNAVQTQDPILDEIQKETQAFNDRLNNCSVLIGSSQASDGIAQNEIEIVPAENLKKGLTHLLKDANGRIVPIGLSRGPSAIKYLRVLGTEVESLLDPGANVSLISKRCLLSIAARKGADLSSLIHPTLHQDCQTANGTGMTIISAAALPVTKNGEEVWVTFQVPRERPPYHVILGTNALSTLGFQLLDVHTGKDYLRIGSDPVEPTANSIGPVVSHRIESAERTEV